MRKLFRPLLISTLCVMALFAIHFVLPSMLNNFSRDYGNFSLQKVWGHTFLTETWQNHLTEPAFAARPMTSWLIDVVHRVLDLSYSYSFVVVEFGLLIVCGVLLYQLALLFSSKREASWSLILFYTSFTILFAFFATIYTYDEPLQYLCFFAALLCLEKKKYPLGIVFLFVSLVARETTILLFPSLLFFIIRRFPLLPSTRLRAGSGEGKGGVLAGEGLKDCNVSLVKTPSNLPLSPPQRDPVFIAGRGGGAKLLLQNILLLFVPVIAAFVSVQLYLAHAGLLESYSTYTGGRFVHFAMNFQNNARGIESLVSPFLALLVPTFLCVYYKKRHAMDERETRYFWAFVLATVINTPIVFFTALAQEIRLFALPLLFLWPCLGKYALFFWQSVKNNILFLKRGEWNRGLLRCSGLLIVTCFVYYLSFRLYIPTALWSPYAVYQLYLFLSLVLIGSGIIFARRLS